MLVVVGLVDSGRLWETLVLTRSIHLMSLNHEVVNNLPIDLTNFVGI